METMKWSGRAIKKQSKRQLKLYYWKYVFMMLLVFLLATSSSWIAGGTSSVYEGLDFIADIVRDSNMLKNDVASSVLTGVIGEVFGDTDASTEGEARSANAILVLVTILGYAGVMVILVELLLIFIVYPVEIGVLRCYNYSYSVKPMLKEVFYCFEHRYKNVVGIIFLKELYITGWTLLFIVPGVVKAYEYRMVPHIIADDPGITAKDAFAMSKAMMRGQKWRTFLLDLSFLGWRILSTLTLGVVGVFYLEPYNTLTRVGLYRKLAGIEDAVANVYLAGADSDYSRL